MIRLLALVLLLLATSLEVLQANEGDCVDAEGVEGECAIPENSTGDPPMTEAEKELALGLNALPVHIAAVTGQLTNVQKCGAWCAEADPTAACRMDTDIVPCEGDFYCTTTCALWHRFVLRDPHHGGDSNNQRPTGTCAMFARFDGYISMETAEICDTSCLLPEIRPHRYPAPTGLGLMCQKNTCLAQMSALADVIPEVPAKLQCPCNWFGSDCPDDWYPIQSIQHTEQFGSDPENAVVATTITLTQEDWNQVVANHQPGGVIRLVHRDPDNWNTEHPEYTRVMEQPYALAFAFHENSTLHILTAPPDKSLHIQTRSVAERVRSLPSGPIQGGNLYVNPSIAGFFNHQWTLLLPFLEQTQQPSIQNVVLLSTGAGLSGTISAVQALLVNPYTSSTVKVHLYHGVRRSQDLPFQPYLKSVQAQIQLTIVESQSPGKMLEGLEAALERGRAQRQLLLPENTSWWTKLGLAASRSSGKVYVQNVVEQEIKNGKFTLENSVFVACGRLALLEETKEMLIKMFCSNADNAYECSQRVGERFFTNI